MDSFETDGSSSSFVLAADGKRPADQVEIGVVLIDRPVEHVVAGKEDEAALEQPPAPQPGDVVHMLGEFRDTCRT